MLCSVGSSGPSVRLRRGMTRLCHVRPRCPDLPWAMRAVCIMPGPPSEHRRGLLGGQRGACRGSRIAAAREHLGFRVSRRSFTLVGFGSGPGGGQRTLMTPPDGPYLSAPGGRVPRAGRSCSRVRGVAGRRSGLLCGCGCAAQPLARARSWSGRCTATTRTCRRCPGGRLASSGAATLWREAGRAPGADLEGGSCRNVTRIGSSGRSTGELLLDDPGALRSGGGKAAPRPRGTAFRRSGRRTDPKQAARPTKVGHSRADAYHPIGSIDASAELEPGRGQAAGGRPLGEPFGEQPVNCDKNVERWDRRKVPHHLSRGPGNRPLDNEVSDPSERPDVRASRASLTWSAGAARVSRRSTRNSAICSVRT